MHAVPRMHPECKKTTHETFVYSNFHLLPLKGYLPIQLDYVWYGTFSSEISAIRKHTIPAITLV